MELDLRNRVALVAASSSGLGRACALALASEGAKVVVSGRDLEKAVATAKDIAQRTNSETVAFACDLSQAQGPAQLVEQCVSKFGQLDVLVTNAGGPPAGTFSDFDDEAWQKAVQLTLLSVVRLVRAALPYLKKSGCGRIINLSSTSVKEPIDNLVLSNSVRPAVIGLARTLARELAPLGITVNNVCPGRIRTNRLTALYGSEEALTKAAKDIPMGRLGEPSDLAPIVVFLAGAPACYITGQTICVDGGLTRSLM
jgi:3-oxoacyl-[acyl-carrier protein] reductase